MGDVTWKTATPISESGWLGAWWAHDWRNVRIYILKIDLEYWVCRGSSYKTIGDKIAGPFPTLDGAKVAYLMIVGGSK